MVRIGNFLFHYRNGLFPLAYVLLLFGGGSLLDDFRLAALLGFLTSLVGQSIRAATIGIEYIVRGGRRRRIYAEKLVTGGVFAHCRNPLYLGNVIILTGVGLASNSLLFLGAALPFFVFAYLAIVMAEENYLRERFRSEYDAYCARVPRFIPSLTGIRETLAQSRFNWRRLITAEYGSTYYWFAGMCVITLRNAWREGARLSGSALVPGLWVSVSVATLGYLAARSYKKGWFGAR
jgi:protein-S-isoprenylcysteine O-methyltransferase Ste14